MHKNAYVEAYTQSYIQCMIQVTYNNEKLEKDNDLSPRPNPMKYVEY